MNKEFFIKIEIKPYYLICVALSILFIILKVNNVIDWAWKWILAPIWIPFAIMGVFIVIGLIIIIINDILY